MEMDTDYHHEARIAVLESEVRTLSASHRDVWDALEKMRACLNSCINEVRKDSAATKQDVASTRLWMVTGVIAVVLPVSAFMFNKLMWW